MQELEAIQEGEPAVGARNYVVERWHEINTWFPVTPVALEGKRILWRETC